MNEIMNKVLSGNNGVAWLDGKQIFSLEKIEGKITGEFSEVNQCGENGTGYAYNGWKGEGTLIVNKTESLGITQMADAFKTGVIPIVKIITKLENKATGKSERAAVYIFFKEFNIMGFEAKANAKEELPFTIVNYDANIERL